MFGEIVFVFVLVMLFRVIWRGQSLGSGRLWLTSLAGSIVGVVATVLFIAATMAPVVGHG